MPTEDLRTKAVLQNVPVIDIGNFEQRKHEIAQELHNAAKNTGFFYCKGHDVDPQLIDALFAAGHKFMELDSEVKNRYAWVPDRYLGWRSQTDLESVTGMLTRGTCQCPGRRPSGRAL